MGDPRPSNFRRMSAICTLSGLMAELSSPSLHAHLVSRIKAFGSSAVVSAAAFPSPVIFGFFHAIGIDFLVRGARRAWPAVSRTTTKLRGPGSLHGGVPLCAIPSEARRSLLIDS
ncbi:hypothetical protein K402DRAFT_392925, partial [Aulographum hederae CBS 113979]